jgi:hypothetical protein
VRHLVAVAHKRFAKKEVRCHVDLLLLEMSFVQVESGGAVSAKQRHARSRSSIARVRAGGSPRKRGV